MTRSADGQLGRVARNSAFLLAAHAVTAAASLASVPVLFDRLGEGAYGVWAPLIGLVSVGALVDLAGRRARTPAPVLRDLRRSDITPVAGYGARVQASKAGAMVNNQADRLLIGAFFDVHTVAGFDLASRFANAIEKALKDDSPSSAQRRAEAMRYSRSARGKQLDDLLTAVERGRP